MSFSFVFFVMRQSFVVIVHESFVAIVFLSCFLAFNFYTTLLAFSQLKVGVVIMCLLLWVKLYEITLHVLFPTTFMYFCGVDFISKHGFEL